MCSLNERFSSEGGEFLRFRFGEYSVVFFNSPFFSSGKPHDGEEGISGVGGELPNTRSIKFSSKPARHDDTAAAHVEQLEAVRLVAVLGAPCQSRPEHGRGVRR